jgi:hypothetical protein
VLQNCHKKQSLKVSMIKITSDRSTDTFQPNPLIDPLFYTTPEQFLRSLAQSSLTPEQFLRNEALPSAIATPIFAQARTP